MASGKSLTYTLIGKDQGLESTLKAAAGQMDATGKAGEKLSSTFKSLGEGIIAGAIAGKMKDFFSSSIESASSLNETISKTQAVFGPASAGIIDFGKNAATALGQSETEALDAADNFGNLFRNLGLTTSKSAEMSTQLVRTASDLGSFFNADPSEMLQNLQSALAGEYDPLQRYGFAINAAAVAQKAVSMGLAETTQNISPAAQAQAAYALILQNTGAAQGDFERTSGGLANQQRILSAGWENMEASLGSALLPTITTAVKIMNEFLGVLSAMPQWMQQTIVGTGALAIGVVSSVTAFSKAKDVVGEVGSAFSGLRGKTTEVAEGMEAVATSGSKFKNALGGVGSFLAGPWGIAIAGGVAVLGYFATKHAEAAQKVSDLTEALKQDSGALGENTRAKTVDQLESDGVIKASKDLGLSLKDVTDAALGNAAAHQRITDALASMKGGLDGTRHGIAGVGDEMASFNSKSGIVTGAIDGQNKALADARDKYLRDGEAMGSTATSAGILKDAMAALFAQSEKAANALLGERGAARNLQTAYEDATAALAKNKRGLDIHTVAGKANQAALDGIASAALADADAMATAGRSHDQVNRVLSAASARFVDLAVKMGMGTGAAQALAAQLFALPNKTVTVTANTSTAASNVASLQSLLAGVHDKTVTVSMITAPGVMRGHSGGGRIAGTPSTKDTELAMLSKGEYVVRSGPTQIWAPLLDRINAGATPSQLASTLTSVSSAVISSTNGAVGGAAGGGTPSVSNGDTYYTINLPAGMMMGTPAQLARELERTIQEAGRSGVKVNLQTA